MKIDEDYEFTAKIITENKTQGRFGHKQALNKNWRRKSRQ